MSGTNHPATPNHKVRRGLYPAQGKDLPLGYVDQGSFSLELLSVIHTGVDLGQELDRREISALGHQRENLQFEDSWFLSG